jgi:hypothetical protein
MTNPPRDSVSRNACSIGVRTWGMQSAARFCPPLSSRQQPAGSSGRPGRACHTRWPRRSRPWPAGRGRQPTTPGSRRTRSWAAGSRLYKPVARVRSQPRNAPAACCERRVRRHTPGFNDLAVSTAGTRVQGQAAVPRHPARGAARPGSASRPCPPPSCPADGAARTWCWIIRKPQGPPGSREQDQTSQLGVE